MSVSVSVSLRIVVGTLMGTKVFGKTVQEPANLMHPSLFSSLFLRFSMQGVLMVHDEFRSVMQYSNIRDGSGRDRVSNDWFCVKVSAIWERGKQSA